MEDISESVSPTAETGLQGKSKLCMDIKNNTALPDFSENLSPSEEETGLQGKSELCVNTIPYCLIVKE